jgi:toxin secretion/phage lysis holin
MKENTFNTIVAISGTVITYIFGGWDTALIVLVVMMALDYVTGLTAAAINKELNSNIGFKGLLRKALIAAVLIVAVLLDRLLNEGTWVFRTLVCYFYIANEGLSILENVGKCGVDLPDKLVNSLEQLKKGEDN